MSSDRLNDLLSHKILYYLYFKSNRINFIFSDQLFIRTSLFSLDYVLAIGLIIYKKKMNHVFTFNIKSQIFPS